MLIDGQIYRLNRARRHRAAAQFFRLHHDPLSPYERRMRVQPWAADSLAALGWFGAADRVLAEAQTQSNNAALDPGPNAELQAGRLRVAARAAHLELDRARRLAWQARSWMGEARTHDHLADVFALDGLVAGLIAEAEGRYDEALDTLLPVARQQTRDVDLPRWIRDVADRCLARRDPSTVAQRRRAEMVLADGERAASMPRWLAGLASQDDGLDVALSVLHALDAPPADATDAVLVRLSMPAEWDQMRATWLFAICARGGRVEEARAALTPLDAAPESSGWPLVAELCRADLACAGSDEAGPSRTLAERLARLGRDADGAIAMVAWSFVSRLLRAAGDIAGAIEAARTAVGHIRSAQDSPFRWLLPAAWPCRALALGSYRDAVSAGADGDGERAAWCRRIGPRVSRAYDSARICGTQF